MNDSRSQAIGGACRPPRAAQLPAATRPPATRRSHFPRQFLTGFVVTMVLTLAMALSAAAKPWWMRGVESNEGDFLPPDVAFKLSSQVAGNVVRVRWVIADGYYLYRHKMEVKAESPDLTVGAVSFPPGTMKTDPYLGTQEVFMQQVEGSVPYTRLDGGAHPMQIKVIYQGCAEAGLCYPPISKVLFPSAAAPLVTAQPHPWEGYAITAGAVAFVLAGLLLRKGRRLDLPAA